MAILELQAASARTLRVRPDPAVSSGCGDTSPLQRFGLSVEFCALSVVEVLVSDMTPLDVGEPVFVIVDQLQKQPRLFFGGGCDGLGMLIDQVSIPRLPG